MVTLLSGDPSSGGMLKMMGSGGSEEEIMSERHLYELSLSNTNNNNQ